jgi:hypothetical protein
LHAGGLVERKDSRAAYAWEANDDTPPRPSEEIMAAARHRPLFVEHRATLGCDVYDICINNEDTMEVFLYRGSPLVEGLPYGPLARRRRQHPWRHP